MNTEIKLGKKPKRIIFDDVESVERKEKNSTKTTENANTLFEDIYQKRVDNATQKYMSWGANNKLPLQVIRWIVDNPLLLPLLSFKVDIAIGDGVETYIEEIDEKGKKIKKVIQDEKITDYLEQIDFKLLSEKFFTDYYFFGNFFCEFISNRGSFVEGYQKGIAMLNHIDATTIRPEFAKTGEASKGFVINPDYNSYNIAYNTYVPKFEEYKIKPKSIGQFKGYFPSQPNFGVATWLGSSQFIEFLNNIPSFKRNLINNAASPSWLVSIPSDYFEKNFPNFSEDELKKERETLTDQIEDYLVGNENAGKVIISYNWKDNTGKETGIKIEAIKNEINDNLFSSDFEQMFQVICSALQVPPSLASIILPGKMSSGSDILNSWNAYNARIERHRQKILEPLYICKRVNGWDKRVKFTFANKELKTTDYAPTGIGQNQF